MQVATLQEDAYDARKKYAEYLRALKQRHTGENDDASRRQRAEYEALKNAYRELARGRQVIDLNAAIAGAGVDDRHRPKLAAIRSDAKFCYFHWVYDWRPEKVGKSDYVPTFSTERGGSATRRLKVNYRVVNKVTLDRDALDVSEPNRKWHAEHSVFRAVVPTIPPALRPKGKLSGYVTLWEADWERIPVDPMLLRPLGQGLYRVLATWDLTPTERAVLGAAHR